MSKLQENLPDPPAAKSGAEPESGAAAAEIEGRAARKDQEKKPDLPAAGPHHAPELTREIATPGTGLIPPAGAHDDMESASS